MPVSSPIEVYATSQGRIIDTVASLDDTDLAKVVPACPDFTVHDLVAHVAGIPAALLGGNFPTGDLQEWLDAIVADHRDTATADLLNTWADLDSEAIANLGNGLLVADTAIHEQDLYGALGMAAERDSDEVRFALGNSIEGLASAVADAGLAPLAATNDDGSWQTSDGEPGCTITASSWEACRALGSRRTADELRALPHEGDIEPYIAIIADHLPLPEQSLGE